MYDFNSDISIETCPVCNHTTIKAGGLNRNLSYSIECSRCSKFDIARECFELRDVEYKIKSNSAKISGYIRLINETRKMPPLITSENIDKILADPMLPKEDDIEKKAEFLLERLKEQTKPFGKLVQLQNEEDYSLAFAQNIEEFDALLKFLEESDYLKLVGDSFDSSVVKLTAKGWKYFQDNSERTKSKNVFIAAWFDDSMNESITAICDVVEKHKLNPICIKDEDFKERIMDKALGEIKIVNF